jgi:uncharacterized membrane protein
MTIKLEDYNDQETFEDEQENVKKITSSLFSFFLLGIVLVLAIFVFIVTANVTSAAVISMLGIIVSSR